VTLPRTFRTRVTCTASSVDSFGNATVTCVRKVGAVLSQKITGTVVVQVVGEDLLARIALTVFP
jgi:hypothetical protein